MTNANTSDALTVNRTFKSTLFIMLFEDKKNLLELYNAITGKHYADPELLEINTLENAIYMSMKNDVSFLIAAGCRCMNISPRRTRIFRCGFCSTFRICIPG